MGKRADPVIAWDPEIGAFRVQYREPPRPLPAPEQARQSVTGLLMKEFGRTLRSTSATVPAHLRPYVKT